MAVQEEPVEDFQLDYAEKVSPLWFKIRGHLANRLENHRRHLEQSIGIDETNRLRGHIRELRAIIRLEDDEPIITNPVRSEHG